MNDEVRKAVEALSREIADPEDCTAWQTILAALRDQEAEIAGYRALLDLLRTGNDGEKYHYGRSRAGTLVNITTHLGATQHD